MIFVLVVFFFLEYPFQISQFLGFELVRLRYVPRGSPAPLVKFRSHQASARIDFTRFICLSSRLSAPGSPRMHNRLISNAFAHFPRQLCVILFMTRFENETNISFEGVFLKQLPGHSCQRLEHLIGQLKSVSNSVFF